MIEGSTSQKKLATHVATRVLLLPVECKSLGSGRGVQLGKVFAKRVLAYDTDAPFSLPACTRRKLLHADSSLRKLSHKIKVGISSEKDDQMST